MSRKDIDVITNLRASEEDVSMFKKELGAVGAVCCLFVEEVEISAANQKTMDTVLPAGFVPLGVVARSKTDVTIATATHFCVGDTDVDRFLAEVAVANVDDKNDQVKGAPNVGTALSAATQPKISFTDGSQTPAGTASGTITVGIFGYTIPSIEAYD